MPELPEAETIARDLRRRVVGRTVTGVHVYHTDILAQGLTPARLNAALRGRRIEGVMRRGKKVVLLFNPALRLLVNLGMTGRLVVGDAPRAAELRHIAARLELDDGRALLYDDIRRFGRLELHTASTWPARNAQFGAEPLDPEFTGQRLFELTRDSRTPIRNWLLDQRRVAGVGNVYANEALFRAGIHPGRPARSLSRDEAAALRDALRQVLEAAITGRGTTLRDYRGGDGEAGGFQILLQIYQREGEPCPRCGAKIERLVLTNRSAFFCPQCQPRRRVSGHPAAGRRAGRARKAS